MSDTVSVTYTFVNGSGHPVDANLFNTNYADIINYLNGRLGAGSSGQVLVADGSGKFTPRTLSGAGTLSNTGALSLTYLQAALGTDLTTLTSSYTDLVTLTPPAGTYFVIGNVVANGGGGGTWEGARQVLSARLFASGVATADLSKQQLGTVATDFATAHGAIVLALDGSVLKLQAKVGNLGFARSASTYLTALRIA